MQNLDPGLPSDAPPAETAASPEIRPQTITRRQAVQRVAMLMGGTLSAPLVSGMLAGCKTGTAYVFRTLTPEQDQLVTAIVDRIIPATNTPGAVAAGVNQFIDHMLTDWYNPDDKAAFLAELATIDDRARQTFASNFIGLDQSKQDELLTTLDAEMIAALPSAGRRNAPLFFRTKELTLAGYYTSEIGMVQELQHSFVPGRFDPCISVEEARPK